MKTASKKVIQKTAEASDDLIGKKLSDKITKVPKSSLQNNSETVKVKQEYLKKDKYPQKEQSKLSLSKINMII